MKILYLCHRFPFTPKRVDQIRSFNMIRHLSRDHEVTVASIVRSDDEAREGRGIAPFCNRHEMVLVKPPIQALRMVSRLPTAVPSSMGFFYSKRLARKVAELL